MYNNEGSRPRLDAVAATRLKSATSKLTLRVRISSEFIIKVNSQFQH